MGHLHHLTGAAELMVSPCGKHSSHHGFSFLGPVWLMLFHAVVLLRDEYDKTRFRHSLFAAFDSTAGRQLWGNISSWVWAAPTANEVPSGYILRGIPYNVPSPETNAALFLSLDELKIFPLFLSVQAVRGWPLRSTSAVCYRLYNGYPAPDTASRRRLLMYAGAVWALRVAETTVLAGYILALKYTYVTWTGCAIFVPVCADRWDKSSHTASHLSLIPKPS